MSPLFDVDLGSGEELADVVEQAREAMLEMSLGTTRQVATARQTIDNLEAQARLLEEESQRDPLTGLANRGRFDSFLATETHQAAQSAKSLSLIMVDVDHFKKVNDTHGHPAGDKVLAGVASILKASLRPRDLVARYGGEEFALVLPDTDPVLVADLLERLRFEDTHVVDQHIDIRQSVNQRAAALPAAQIGRYPHDGGLGHRALQALDRAGDACLRPSVEGHLRSFAGQHPGSGKTDAHRRSSQERALSFES